MIVPCPHCSQDVNLEDAGRFACPHCGNEFEAVQEPKAPKPTPPPPPPALSPFDRWRANMAKQGVTGICTACGTAGKPVITRRGGSAIIAFGLWVFCIPAFMAWAFGVNILVPFLMVAFALGYSAWCAVTPNTVGCGRCSARVIPIDSPAGVELFNRFHAAEAPVPRGQGSAPGPSAS